MAKFENMTLSYTQIASIPFKVRKSASGSLLDALSRELTPGQRVALFPSYVNQLYASAKYEAPKEGETTPLSGGGTAFVPSTVEKYTPTKKAPPKGKPDIIPAGLIPGPDGKPMRVPDTRMASSDIKTGDRFKDVVRNYKSRMMKDLGITDFQADGVLGNLAQESDRFRAYNEYGGGPGIGWAQWTTKARKEAFLSFANENGLDPKSDEASYLYLVHEIQNRPDLLPGGAKTLDKLRETKTAEEATESFMNNFEAPGVPHFDTRLQYTSEIAGIPYTEEGLNETERIPNVYDTQEEATAEPIMSNASVSYDTLRAEYPDTIDEDSSIWDKVDPALKAMKSEIVDKEGRRVGLETLIAADAASKVLRRNGMSPRIVSGGREPSEGSSTNHGQYSNVNRSIDMQAYDASGKEVHLGQIDHQIRKDILTAAQLSVRGENVRLGVPTDNSTTGFHLQAGGEDKDGNLLPQTIWGYKSGEPHKKATLLKYGPEFNTLFNDNTKLDEDEKKRRLEALIGPTIEEKQPVETTTRLEETAKTENIVPLEDTEDGKPANTSTSKSTSYTMGELTGTDTGALRTVPGVNAAAGGAEITEPSMIISEDGKKVTRVAETGPEKISVMPRHKSSDVYQEDRTFTQEMQREVAQENLSKRDIAEQKSNPMPSNFGQQRNYGGQTTFINTDMPKVPPSANKAFADAKLVSRFNKADIDGDMGIVYVDRGYA